METEIDRKMKQVVFLIWMSWKSYAGDSKLVTIVADRWTETKKYAINCPL